MLPDEPTHPQRVPRNLADRLIRRLGGWMDGEGDGTGDPASDPASDPRNAGALRRLISAHGLAPFLARDPVAAPARATFSDELRSWLADEDERNRLRIDRLHAELAATLAALAANGIPVMPLKGAILTTTRGTDPHRRPMSDVDLLVHPVDRDAARATLTGIGYRRRLDRSRWPTHDTFELPGNERVVTMDGEHPDNPRRIELHVEVKRHLWGWVDDDDLTPFLWAGASSGRVLGEAAVLPTLPALLAHLAIHATSDLLLARGRLIQWLDIVEMAPMTAAIVGDGLTRLPHPRLVFPALRLAARRLPRRLSPVEAAWSAALADLESRVPPRLARWAATVPLDTRAGLQSGRLLPADVQTLGARWDRWAPYPWRLAVAHGEAPLAIAAARHLARVVTLARRRPV
jgi:hypothetical protein